MTTRRDGRKPDEVRAITVSFERLARVDGSARFGFGETSVLASLSGPIEVRLASELPSKATFEVLVRPLSNIAATEAKSIAATIRSTVEPSLILTKNPRTLVQLVIQSLSTPRHALWKDTLLAAMVNASSLALLNASSVPMRGVVCAAAVGRLADGRLLLDPSDDESADLKAGGSFAFMFADGAGLGNTNSDCVWSSWKLTSDSYYDELEVFRARELARSGARIVYEAIRTSLSNQGKHLDDKTQPTVKENESADKVATSEDDDKMEI